MTFVAVYILIIILGIGLFLQYHERIAMLFSHYVQKWIISGKNIVNFYGKLTLVYLISRGFFFWL